MTQNPGLSPWPDPDDELDLDGDDPYETRVPITLTAPQQTDLVRALDRALRAGGCDNTLRAAQRWAEEAPVSWPRLQRELEANGGFCDCEILFNAFPGAAPD